MRIDEEGRRRALMQALGPMWRTDDYTVFAFWPEGRPPVCRVTVTGRGKGPVEFLEGATGYNSYAEYQQIHRDISHIYAYSDPKINVVVNGVPMTFDERPEVVEALTQIEENGWWYCEREATMFEKHSLGGSVVDIGCGIGVMSLYFSGLGSEVFAFPLGVGYVPFIPNGHLRGCGYENTPAKHLRISTGNAARILRECEKIVAVCRPTVAVNCKIEDYHQIVETSALMESWGYVIEYLVVGDDVGIASIGFIPKEAA